MLHLETVEEAEKEGKEPDLIGDSRVAGMGGITGTWQRMVMSKEQSQRKSSHSEDTRVSSNCTSVHLCG